MDVWHPLYRILRQASSDACEPSSQPIWPISAVWFLVDETNTLDALWAPGVSPGKSLRLMAAGFSGCLAIGLFALFESAVDAVRCALEHSPASPP